MKNITDVNEMMSADVETVEQIAFACLYFGYIADVLGNAAVQDDGPDALGAVAATAEVAHQELLELLPQGHYQELLAVAFGE